MIESPASSAAATFDSERRPQGISIGLIFLASTLSLFATVILAQVSTVWNLTGLTMLFVVPVGAMAIGAGYGAVAGGAFRIANKVPQMKDLAIIGVLGTPLFIAGDAAQWFAEVATVDGEEYRVKDYMTFSDYFGHRFTGKREVRVGRGAAKVGEYEAIPWLERLKYLFGLVVLGGTASGVMASLTRDQPFCNRCQSYLKKAKGKVLYFETIEALTAHLGAAFTVDEAANSVTPAQLKFLVAAPQQKSQKEGFHLTVDGYRCMSCDRKDLVLAGAVFKGSSSQKIESLAHVFPCSAATDLDSIAKAVPA